MENYKKLNINPAIKIIQIYGYKRYRGDFIYRGKGDLHILNIPDGSQLRIKGYFRDCGCGASITYRALWKNGVLYKIE